MTLAEAIRRSIETGCEFWWEGPWTFKWDPTAAKTGGVLARNGNWGRWRHQGYFLINQILADDWEVEQTAPHGEGM